MCSCFQKAHVPKDDEDTSHILSDCSPTLFPSLDRFVPNPIGGISPFGILVYGLLLSVPFTTAYSVLVNEVLDVKLIVRKALQYALARYTVMALTALPFGLLVYQLRDRRITQLFSGPRPPGLIGATILGLAALSVRERVLKAIDRHFFREAYDSPRILSEFMQNWQSATNVEEYSAGFLETADSLNLESLSMLTLDRVKGEFRSVRDQVRPLGVGSSLARFLQGNTDPVDVDIDNPESPLSALTTDDCEWLADSGAHLLVPLIGTDGSLLGLLALGEKKSELPFSEEDRNLLKTIAASEALMIENRFVRPVSAGEATFQGFGAGDSVEEMPVGQVAFECKSCGTLRSERVSPCTCGGTFEPASVPKVIPDKFEFKRRLGAGGMGVVYSAIDLTLGRRVAVKTLPNTSPEAALLLRNEGLKVAALEHPNLATIFTVETWFGTPMLIFEFLAGGTLVDKLRLGNRSIAETIRLGIVLADALERVHASNMLHRDIKPGNIGYTREGIPKLLDFGLAQILEDRRRKGLIRSIQLTDPEAASRSTLSSESVSITLSGPASFRLVGTPSYFSPEALLKKRASDDASRDLWALNIVLYEALTGKNPVRGETLLETLEAISKATIPDIRQFLPDCPANRALFFTDALAKDERRRPSSAKALRASLEQLEKTLPESGSAANRAGGGVAVSGKSRSLRDPGTSPGGWDDKLERHRR